MDRRAIQYTLFFVLCSVGCGQVLTELDLFPAAWRPGVAMAVGYTLTAAVILTVAYAARAWGRAPEGVLFPGSGGGFWAVAIIPYRLGAGVVMAGLRLLSPEPMYHQIRPNLYVGAIPLPWDRHRLPVRHILNLCFEFPPSSWYRKHDVTVAWMPWLDGVAPTEAQLQAAVGQLCVLLEAGQPVLVHCAQGHGRSVVVVAAWLLQHGGCDSVSQAVEEIRGIRPGIRLNAGHHHRLESLLQRGRPGVPPVAAP